MGESWKETKKEFEIDHAGNQILKKVTKEASFKFGNIEKEKWTFIFQVISSSGIIIALFGIMANLYVQNKQHKFQIEQEKSIYELGIFSKAYSTMYIISNSWKNDKDFYNASNELHRESIPKLFLLHNDSLISNITTYDSLLTVRLAMFQIVDSFWSLQKVVDEFKEFTCIQKDSKKLRLDDLSKIRGFRRRIYEICCDLDNIHKFFSDQEGIRRVLRIYDSKVDETSCAYLCDNLGYTVTSIRDAFECCDSIMERKFFTNDDICTFNLFHTTCHDSETNQYYSYVMNMNCGLANRMVKIQSNIFKIMRKSNKIISISER